jgi:hypothetical protein
LADNLISTSVNTARRNWNDWRDIFEHPGSVADNPLLADQGRFAHFLREYSVRRTIRAGTHEQLRLKLAKSENVFRYDTGDAIDNLERNLRDHFGTHDGRNRLISALSKVAAFIRPERFVACNSYAKKGLNIVRGRAASRKFDTHADYLAPFDEAWNGELGQEIRDHMKNDVQSKAEGEPRFQRRILDVYLMVRGDRWKENKWLLKHS